jgi:hypothetical protein
MDSPCAHMGPSYRLLVCLCRVWQQPGERMPAYVA